MTTTAATEAIGHEALVRPGVESAPSGQRQTEGPHSPNADREPVALRANIVSNLATNVWAAVAAIGAVPFYIRFLGITEFGLVAFYSTLQALFVLLDAGLSTSLNRSLSSLSVQKDSGQEMRDTVRSLEVPYWGIAGAIAAVSFLFSSFATDWFHGSGVPRGSLGVIVLLMGLAAALQFPFALYSGGLLGLQRQVLLNAVVAIFVGLRTVGAVAVLWLVSPTLEAFFVWQAALSLAQSVVTGIALWRELPEGARPARIRFTVLRRVMGFAAAMSVIGAQSIVLTQGPRLLMSRIMDLTHYAYFSVGVVVSSGLYYLITPIFAAAFPRFTQLVTLGRDDDLKILYHRVCQLTSGLILPIAAVLIFFSPQVLLAWTGNRSVVGGSAWITTLLVAGTALQSLAYMPYALQLAHAWTKLAIYMNLAIIAAVLPLTAWAAIQFGGIGAACIWLGINTCYVVFGIRAMHSRLLRGEAAAWYLHDVAPAAVAALVVSGLLRLTLPAPTGRLAALSEVALAAVLAMTAAALALPAVRAWLLQHRTRLNRLVPLPIR
ncbi:MAG TPA: hypothetical protein VG815_16705 [Chloroflexota bacterium]|jgi:O-antigen/teichoic acid export membrane protein|nr:hypothetical protein [Chloroflexota bacterium]